MIKKEPRADRRNRRHQRNRSVIIGTAKRPRLSIFRSEKHIYAQLIDDERSSTLASASSVSEDFRGKTKVKAIKDTKKKETKAVPAAQPKTEKKGSPTELAKSVGTLVAKRALEIGIREVVFDRGGSKYHGRVKALADGAREAGLVF